MSVRTRTQGKTDANTYIPDNDNQEVSPEDVRQRIIDLWDSAVSKKGDSGIQGKLSYSGNFTFADDKDIPSVKFVNDAIANIDLTGVIYADGSVDFAANQSMGGFVLEEVSGFTDTFDVTFIGSDNRRLFDKDGSLLATFYDIDEGFGVSTSSYIGYFKTSLLGANATYELPSVSGTIALLSDIEIYFVGTYASLAALQSAHPTGSPGEYGIVDAGVGTDAIQYIWDNDDNDWVAGSGGGGVTSFNSRVGAVTPQTGDYTTSQVVTAGSITNTMLAGSIDLTTKVTGVLPSANGGTGINNGSKTITLGGNLVTSGAFNLTLAVPQSTTYTLPNTANDTLAGIGTANVFGANQTISTGFTLTVASDTDATTILGRVRIYSATTNVAMFAHFDINTTTGYALSQNTSGVTSLNGTEFRLKRNNSDVMFCNNSTFITLSDNVSFELGTGTGTKIGRSTSQKLGFWNATPIIQPASANQAALTDSTTGTPSFTLVDVGIAFSQTNINNNFSSVYRVINEMRNVLVNTGLMKGAA